MSRAPHRYDFVYKQSVMTEDTFLGMAGKTPGSQVRFETTVALPLSVEHRMVTCGRLKPKGNEWWGNQPCAFAFVGGDATSVQRLRTR